jgi:putative spermidine/putrescine transport system substrate-binding protein
VVIPSLQNTEGLAMFMIAAMLESGKPIKEAQYLPEAAFKKLKALKPNLLTIYTQIPQALNLLEQGEASVIAGMVSVNTYERKTKGAPVDLIMPKEGAMAMPSGIAKVKNGPDPDLSYAFINEMLGAYQTEIAELSLAMPTNPAAKAPANLPKADVFTLDWAYVNEQRKGWVERWDKEMAL